jgi:site-specific DNA-methyltransferase (adenine-specific)
MKTLPDKSIDLFLCDLPYGCLTGGGGKEKAKRGDGNVIGGCVWDIKIDLVAFWVQVKRLCRNDHTPVIHFCSTKFGFDLIASNPDWFRHDLVWSKSSGVGFLTANKMPLRSHEMIYVFAKKGANYTRVDIEGDFKEWKNAKGVLSGSVAFGGGLPRTTINGGDGKRCVKSVIEVANKKGKGNHPTQKPDDLYSWLIERYSKEGDTILDPTAGSFVSCLTAQKMGRNAIGIEMNEDFYNKAVSALQATAVKTDCIE